VAQSTSPVSDVAGRYAGSLFELALDERSVSQVEYDLLAFESLIDESADLKRLIESPVFSADDQYRAISAIVERAGLHGLVGKFLKVVAKNRRLFAVPGMIKAFRAIAAAHRGEVVAEVKAAHALTRDQEAALKAALADVAGKIVTVKVTIDPTLLGGLVVKMGSRQIDTSLKTKLNSLKLALKEVG
jgi:F-type H+-transporting ATPase subunit delta